VKEELVQAEGVIVHRYKNRFVVMLDSGPQIRALLSGPCKAMEFG
jgi:hypothetical protein